MQKFRIAATGHSLNYLPEYIAHRRGFFAEQDLDVTVSVPSPWDLVLTELRNGSASAALGGIWVPSMYHDRVRRYTAFAQVANRAPLALVGRVGAAAFSFDGLRGRTVLMKGSNGASVGLYLKMLLRENAVEPTEVNYIQDLDGTMLADLFSGGMGDYLLVDYLSARALLTRHDHLEIVLEAVSDGGDIPWSVYYCEAETITPEVLDVQERFCFGLHQDMEWIMERDAESFRTDLADLFPNVPTDVAVQLANVFRRDRMWTTPMVNRAGYDRWQQGIAGGHLVPDPLPYRSIVDDGPAAAATYRFHTA